LKIGRRVPRPLSVFDGNSKRTKNQSENFGKSFKQRTAELRIMNAAVFEQTSSVEKATSKNVEKRRGLRKTESFTRSKELRTTAGAHRNVSQQ
jgi:hypothetical protein